LTIKINAFCVPCNKSVEGKLTEMVVLDSGNCLHIGECPVCCLEIKRIVPQDNSGSYNGRRLVSETNNEGPIPSPEA
jgi:hypothetical protein